MSKNVTKADLLAAVENLKLQLEQAMIDRDNLIHQQKEMEVVLEKMKNVSQDAIDNSAQQNWSKKTEKPNWFGNPTPDLAKRFFAKVEVEVAEEFINHTRITDQGDHLVLAVSRGPDGKPFMPPADFVKWVYTQAQGKEHGIKLTVAQSILKIWKEKKTAQQ